MRRAHWVHDRLITACLILVLANLLSTGCDKSESENTTTASNVNISEVTDRPEDWATEIQATGVGNFYKLDDHLYRSEQPEEEGFAAIKEMGIKTVVNLRTHHSDRDKCEKYGLDYVKITVQAWEGEDEEVVEFLKVVTDESRWPVLVHCQHGADRTGMMCAVYRMAVQGWDKQKAISEMVDGGYGFHSVWKNLIEYLEQMDIEQIKLKAGLIEDQPD